MTSSRIPPGFYHESDDSQKKRSSPNAGRNSLAIVHEHLYNILAASTPLRPADADGKKRSARAAHGTDLPNRVTPGQAVSEEELASHGSERPGGAGWCSLVARILLRHNGF